MKGIKQLKRFSDERFRKAGKKDILVGVSVTAAVLVGGWVLYHVKLKIQAPPQNLLEAAHEAEELLAGNGEPDELGVKLIPQGSAEDLGPEGKGWSATFHGKALHTIPQIERFAGNVVRRGIQVIQKIALREE